MITVNNIQWTKCADQMPPDDNTDVVLRNSKTKSLFVTTGNVINMTSNNYPDSNIQEDEWIVYTDGVLKEI